MLFRNKRSATNVWKPRTPSPLPSNDSCWLVPGPSRTSSQLSWHQKELGFDPFGDDSLNGTQLQSQLMEISLKIDLIYWPEIVDAMIDLGIDWDHLELPFPNFSRPGMPELVTILKSQVISSIFAGLDAWLENEPILQSWIEFAKQSQQLKDQLILCYGDVSRKCAIASLARMFENYVVEDWQLIYDALETVNATFVNELLDVFWTAKANSFSLHTTLFGVHNNNIHRPHNHTIKNMIALGIIPGLIKANRVVCKEYVLLVDCEILAGNWIW